MIEEDLQKILEHQKTIIWYLRLQDIKIELFLRFKIIDVSVKTYDDSFGICLYIEDHETGYHYKFHGNERQTMTARKIKDFLLKDRQKHRRELLEKNAEQD